MPVARSAESFDQWYADQAGSSAADELAQRVLGLPADLLTTSLLNWDALPEVVAALDVRQG